MIFGLQDPNAFADDWKLAFEEAVGEFNNFGLASTNAKFQIDSQASMTMYGFKVPVFDSQVR